MKLYIFVILSTLFFDSSFSCIFLKLSEGDIKGRLATTPDGTIFYSFQQIPYAAAPVGRLRFQPPQAVIPWDGVLDATRNTKICYQIDSISSDQENEDCIFLNIYTPALPSKNKSIYLPVMVYFHGGGFILGDASHRSYGPEFLIKHDVIIVTLNYRLGVFGFLSTQDNVISGNNGLKDQLFALQWVNRNIHLFGGDPSKITIFGQSAGASSAGYHLISKKSWGLYRGAIMESSSALSSFGYQRNARYYAYKLASYIFSENITEDTTTSAMLLDLMLNATVSEIDEASEKVASEENYDTVQLIQGCYYAPVVEVESEDAFLTEKMFEVISRGDANKVPIIIGINSEEGISQSTDLDFLRLLMGAYDVYLQALVPNDMNIESESQKKTVGTKIREIYSPNDLLQNVPAGGIKFLSDTMFTRSVISHAALQSRYSDVYFYQFSYDGAMGNVSVVVEGAERVGHNEEIAYLWRSVNAQFNNYDLSIYPEADIITQKRLLTLWTNFAKTLHPTPERDDLLENIIWPKVSSSNDFPYLNINVSLEITHYPKKDSYNAWVALYDEFGNPPFDTY